MRMQGFPGGTSGKEPACRCRRHEIRVRSLSWEDPLKDGMSAYTSVLALENPMDQRSLTGYSPWGHKRVEHT